MTKKNQNPFSEDAVQAAIADKESGMQDLRAHLTKSCNKAPAPVLEGCTNNPRTCERRVAPLCRPCRKL